MPEREDHTHGLPTPAEGSARDGDDRRSQVNPADAPVPRSPEPEQDAVREGEEKLERL